jgi:SagB-type dehydrogenase family enzyme
MKDKGEAMKLPEPITDGDLSLEKTIQARRTVRSFSPEPLSLHQLSQLLWATYGITDDRGFKRAAPSGGALYPMDVYGVVGENGIHGLAAGVYHYESTGHTISMLAGGDHRLGLSRAALSQMWIGDAPLSLLITAEYSRITSKYGRRGIRYALMEAGHMGQNLFLQAEALGLGVGIVGAFDDNQVTNFLHLPKAQEPLLIMPVGHKR